MKIKFVIPFLAVCAGFSAARADVLTVIEMKLTGSIQQQSASSGATEIPSRAVSIKTILELLGITGQDPKALDYYFDGTTNSYVIATKGLADGAEATPVATVYTYDSNYKSIEANPKRYLYAGPITAMNGILTGTFYEKYLYGPRSDNYEIVTYGTIDSLDTIVRLKATIK